MGEKPRGLLDAVVQLVSEPVANFPKGDPLKNPWLKKNPFLSMWLSGANAALGSARGHATAQAKRQANAAMTEATKQMVSFWSGGWIAPPPAKKRRRKRST